MITGGTLPGGMIVVVSEPGVTGAGASGRGSPIGGNTGTGGSHGGGNDAGSEVGMLSGSFEGGASGTRLEIPPPCLDG